MRIEKLGIVAVVAVVALSGSAWAEDSKSVRKIEDLNRAAMEDYDLLEFENAKKQLAEALATAKKAKLDKHAVTAKTHVNLGIVYGGGLNDNDSALLEFKAALEADPAAKLPPAYKTPALTKLFDQAKSSAAAAPEVTGPPDDGTPPPVLPSIKITAPDEAPGGKDIEIIAKLGPDVAKARSVVLYYQAENAEKFTSVSMKSGAEGYAANIPAKAAGGGSVHYYVEAKSSSGKVLATVGTSGAPSTISLIQPRVAGGGEKPPEEENPLGNEKPPEKNGGGGEIGGPTGGGEETGLTAEGGEPLPVKPKKFWIGVGVGTGAGMVNGETEVTHQAIGCCLALAPFHLMPEVGFFLKPKLTLSLLVRLGFPVGANVEGAATMAPAGFVRLGYFLDKNPTGAGVYVHGDIGAGFIRDVVSLKKQTAGQAQGDTDTYASGPLFVGGGVGWVKPLGGTLRFVADLNIEAGIPIISKVGDGPTAIKPGFALNIDANLGLQIAF